MCGISGIVTRAPLSDRLWGRVVATNAALTHRGPDGVGEWRGDHVALAMRRLSIIDPNGGWQPLYNEDRSVILIANGEIYNFIELREELQARGHVFRTGSDCETVAHLYEDYGDECVHHLRGMYAIALWDQTRQRLLLARDRMGEKPLYVYQADGLILFASEVKAMLRSGLVPFALDPVAVNQFFHYQYVPEPGTPIRGLRKLPAAHTLTVEVPAWRVREACYWKMEDAPPIERAPVDVIREELETVSSLLIRSDVPVGIALSGGLDSSAIAALTQAKYPGTMHAFSVGYSGRPENDERSAAHALADHLGMPFHDIELSTQEMVAFFPELNYWRDDPIADISGMGYYAVMKLAREHRVPVVLQGQGGDEVFRGYRWVAEATLETLKKYRACQLGWRALPDYLALHWPQNRSREALSRWLREGYGLRSGWIRYKQHRASPPERLVFYDLNDDFISAQRGSPALYTSAFNDQLRHSDPCDLFRLEQPWRDPEVKMTELICSSYLLENGVAQGDRLSMASSVELRLPLLDYRLVEKVIGLRKAHSDARLPLKLWLVQAMQDLLPKWVLNRPKRGFAPPLREWHWALFQAYGRDLIDGFLVSHAVLTPESARHLAQGPFPEGQIVPLSFKALVLETWCRQMSAAAPTSNP